MDYYSIILLRMALAALLEHPSNHTSTLDTDDGIVL